MTVKTKDFRDLLAGPLAADLILHNGKIATFDQYESFSEAVAVKNGRFHLIGDSETAFLLSGPRTEVIDLAGRTVIPGLIDSHCHFDQHAIYAARWIDLGWPAVRSVEECLALIRKKTDSLPSGVWFQGVGYDDKKLGGYPTLVQLDAAAGGRPLFIFRTDHHIALVNSAAFAACQIDKDTPNPEFGQYDRDPETGELTGLVREDAAKVIANRLRDVYTVDDFVHAFPARFEEYLSYGITSVHNSLTTGRAIQAYQILRRQGRLPMRIGIIVTGREIGLVESYISAGLKTGFGDEWVRIIGVEWCPDCSTSGRTAAYYDPYVGQPVKGEPVPNRGQLLYESENLKTLAMAAHKAGLRVCMDGVGDRGIDFVLDIYADLLKAFPVDDHRLRVEHCCCVTPKILERLRQMNVMDSSATGFMHDLGDAYIANRGAEAMDHMWPHRSLIDAGVPAAGHSDAGVCHVNPMRAIYSMVARKTDTGQPIGSAQAVTVTEAIRAYTWLGAYIGNEEAIKGSIEPGKLADMVVLDRDVFTVPVEEIREVRADMTIVGGMVRYRRCP